MRDANDLVPVELQIDRSRLHHKYSVNTPRSSTVETMHPAALPHEKFAK